MHDATIVIDSSQSIHNIVLLLCEIACPIVLNIFPVDKNVIISVIPALLVEKPNSVVQLVQYDADIVTGRAQNEVLRSSVTTDRRMTALSVFDDDIVLLLRPRDPPDTGLYAVVLDYRKLNHGHTFVTNSILLNDIRDNVIFPLPIFDPYCISFLSRCMSNDIALVKIIQIPGLHVSFDNDVHDIGILG